jgi:hypothetical protein
LESNVSAPEPVVHVAAIEGLIKTLAESFDAQQREAARAREDIAAVHQALIAHDMASTRDRAGLREMLISLQRSMDRRFDEVWRVNDQQDARLDDLEAARTEVHMRLADADEWRTEMDEWRTLLEQRLAKLEGGDRDER